MNILFLSHYFPPEVNAPASRTYEHCKHWVELGHAVTVITCAPNHPRGAVYPGYKNRVWQKETKDGIQVRRVWTYLAANEGFIKRTLNYVSYMFTAIIAALFIRKPDIVLTTSPQFFNGLAGYFVSRLRRIPWVLEIRDLWPDSILIVGAIKNKIIINFLRKLELFAYRKCDHIVVVTESFKKYLIDKGIAIDKVEVLKNGAELSFFKPSARDENFADGFGIRGKFVVSYFGTHGMAHKLETVLDAAKLLAAEEGIVFLMTGDGAEKERLLEMSRLMNLTNLKMLPQQDKANMPYLWALSDVSLVLLKKSELFKTVIPSKIFESLAMECPIILGVEGESQELITTADAGICIEPENPRQLADAVLSLYTDYNRRIEMGKAGRKYIEQHYDRQKLAKRYSNLLEDVLLIKLNAAGVASEHTH
ncbi:MAG: glycosyltransferase family 4 protein [Gammaproteobacteria bacterium]|nr:glycosyltransferase family 4 protein [Gammaproteobacteria bacterium]